MAQVIFIQIAAIYHFYDILFFLWLCAATGHSALITPLEFVFQILVVL